MLALAATPRKKIDCSALTRDCFETHCDKCDSLSRLALFACLLASWYQVFFGPNDRKHQRFSQLLNCLTSSHSVLKYKVLSLSSVAQWAVCHREAVPGEEHWPRVCRQVHQKAPELDQLSGGAAGGD